MKKIKIIATSDWHGGGEKGFTQEVGTGFNYDKTGQDGDIFMFAGDLTGMCEPNDSETQKRQFDEFLHRLEHLLDVEKRNWKYIVGVFGNHDTAFDENHKYGKGDYNLSKYFKRKKKEFNKKYKGRCEMLWENFITKYKIEVKGREVSIIANPHTDKIHEPDPGAFHWTNRTSVALDRLASKPVDIILSHDPVRGYGDRSVEEGRCGTKEFFGIKHKPRVFISGHIHEGYGVSKGKGEFEGTTFYSVAHLNRDYEPGNDFVEIEI